ncbi:unnamed protein product [Closterium sp. NIES-65]|nr:unnamed protein product [Closterium sp. NIES-65]
MCFSIHLDISVASFPRRSGVRGSGVRGSGVRASGASVSGVRMKGVRVNGVGVSGVRVNGVGVSGVRVSVGWDELGTAPSTSHPVPPCILCPSPSPTAEKKPSAGAYPVMKLMGPDGALPHYTREELDVAPTTTPHPVIPRLRPSSSLMAEKKPSAGAYPVMKPKKPSAGAYPVMKPVGPDGALPHYTREELTAATSNWTQKIGEGGFGTVYKGYLRSDGSSRIGGISSSSSNGKSGSSGNSGGAGGGGEGGAGEGGEGGEVLVPVAVKMCTSGIKDSGREQLMLWWLRGGGRIPVAVKMCTSGIKDSGREQLMTEVMVMTAVQHPYILRLLGVATLGETLAMVSEFVPHGDVDLLLERVRNREDSFDWTARMVLAEQVGEALVFIHSKGVLGSIHPQPLPSCHFIPATSSLPPCCPLSPRQGMVPKVADFGMARLVEDWKTHVTTRVGGSQGYIDPNYFSTGFLTNHCDTYAFGIFLLELMSGECAEENGFKAIRVAAEERLIPLEKLKRVVMDKTIAGQWSEEHEKPAAPHPDLKPLGGDGAPPMYTKAELSAATNNFKHKLGEGGFGAVYKGYLKVESGAEAAESLGVDLSAVSDGEIPVAVKMCAAKVLSAREQLMVPHGGRFWAPHGSLTLGAMPWRVGGLLGWESGVEGRGGEIPVVTKMCAAKVLSAREQLMVGGSGAGSVDGDGETAAMALPPVSLPPPTPPSFPNPTEMMVMERLRHPTILRLLRAGSTTHCSPPSPTPPSFPHPPILPPPPHPSPTPPILPPPPPSFPHPPHPSPTPPSFPIQTEMMVMGKLRHRNILRKLGKTEMMVMGKLRHPNILRLLGACISDDSMAMIYEFIPCGDVHELLEDEPQRLLGACISDDQMAMIHEFIPCGDVHELLEDGGCTEGGAGWGPQVHIRSDDSRAMIHEFIPCGDVHELLEDGTCSGLGALACACVHMGLCAYGAVCIWDDSMAMITKSPVSEESGDVHELLESASEQGEVEVRGPNRMKVAMGLRAGKEEFKYEDRMKVAMGSRAGKEELKFEDRMKVAMGSRAGKEEFKYEDRMKVAMGCAEALAFIHGQEYVHRDFKAPNVLLAEGLSPRVADFGLARIVENWKDHVTTRVMGSRGYIDPEYFESGYLNEHCDTFAFGIFLIELATGHSVLEAKFDDVVNGAVRSDDVDLGAVMDPRLQGQWSEEQAKTLLGVAKVCITTDWDDRPTMDNVVEMMQGVM